jgi:hypothetical protein
MPLPLGLGYWSNFVYVACGLKGGNRSYAAGWWLKGFFGEAGLICQEQEGPSQKVSVACFCEVGHR